MGMHRKMHPQAYLLPGYIMGTNQRALNTARHYLAALKVSMQRLARKQIQYKSSHYISENNRIFISITLTNIMEHAYMRRDLRLYELNYCRLRS